MKLFKDPKYNTYLFYALTISFTLIGLGHLENKNYIGSIIYIVLALISYLSIRKTK